MGISMLIDAITLVFVFLMCIRGKKVGFIKTALGMVSVLVCGILTVLVYNYISGLGMISLIELELFSYVKPETAEVLKLSGIVGYIISGITAILIFCIIRFLYGIVADILSFAVPKFLNSTLGAVLGFLKGVLVVVFVLAIVHFVSGSVPEIVDKIDGTTLVSRVYYNNPILTIFKI